MTTYSLTLPTTCSIITRNHHFQQKPPLPQFTTSTRQSAPTPSLRTNAHRLNANNPRLPLLNLHSTPSPFSAPPTNRPFHPPIIPTPTPTPFLAQC